MTKDGDRRMTTDLLYQIKVETINSNCIKHKNAVFLTIQEPAVAVQLFQSGQHQPGHHMVGH